MPPNRLPILDLGDDIAQHWDEYTSAFAAVLKSGQFIGGQNVVEFEREAAAYLAVDHCVACNSGTDALILALRALNVGPGDEVITTPFTFFATAEAISMVGATPVFCDVDLDTMNIDPSLLPGLVTAKTKALLPVHLFGLPAQMNPLMAVAREHGLAVIEDVAQAMGAATSNGKAGSIGNAGAFSFFPSKNLGAFGDGGMLGTNDPTIADSARKLRNHGSIVRYQNEALGYNSRLDEMQAAVLRIKLRHLDSANAARLAVARRYSELLSSTPGVITPVLDIDGDTSVVHQYTVRITGGRRDHVAAHLDAAGISTMVYYPSPVHRLPVYDLPLGLSPRAEQLATEVLSLPIWPTLHEDQQVRIASALIEALNER